MERWGLVARLEVELERIISLGLLPKDGRLPSERVLASQYGVSRSTAREAMVRLRARGLVEVHPGKRARAVVMEERARLEHLGVALLAEGTSRLERKQLLAGYLELKRQALVELLSACCERAREEELEKVRWACFQLGEAVRWEWKRPEWLALEFELLRQAARVAHKPGHWMLIQTLEQACLGVLGRVEPYLDSAALYGWTQCAQEALNSREVEALRTRLQELLRASDERVLQALAPTCEAHGAATLLCAQVQEPDLEAEAPSPMAQEKAVSEPTEVAPTPAQALEVLNAAVEHTQAEGRGALRANWSGLHTTSREAHTGALLPCQFLPCPAPGPVREGTGHIPHWRTPGLVGAWAWARVHPRAEGLGRAGRQGERACVSCSVGLCQRVP